MDKPSPYECVPADSAHGWLVCRELGRKWQCARSGALRALPRNHRSATPVVGWNSTASKERFNPAALATIGTRAEHVSVREPAGAPDLLNVEITHERLRRTK